MISAILFISFFIFLILELYPSESTSDFPPYTNPLLRYILTIVATNMYSGISKFLLWQSILRTVRKHHGKAVSPND